MTDRVQALTVTLEQDTRTDDAERLVQAIEMLRGVESVSKLWIADMDAHVARMRLRTEIGARLLDVLNGETRRDR